jgi:hypothetical protein
MGQSTLGRQRLRKQFAVDTEGSKEIKPSMMRGGERKKICL